MARMRTQTSRSTMQQQHQNTEQPCPSPSAYEDGDIIYIDFEGRRVAIAWSASLETAKATACEDFGLTSHGYSAKDIAFFFHANDDESKPLIELMASAWKRMRPIPTLYLALAPLCRSETCPFCGNALRLSSLLYSSNTSTTDFASSSIYSCKLCQFTEKSRERPAQDCYHCTDGSFCD